MFYARLVTGVAAMSVVLLVAACGSSGHPASGAASAHSSTPTSSLASSSTASSVAATPAPTGSASPTASPSATTAACAAMAAHTFVHVTAVKAGTSGSLTLTGNLVTLVCGGPDDLHYDIAATTVTAHVIPCASVMIFPLPAMHLEAIRPYQLASYLASDEDTRIFLVTGPLSRITGLQEEYHP